MKLNVIAPIDYSKADTKTFVECRTCLFDSSIAKIHSDGECEYCKLQTELRNSSRAEDWPGVLMKIKEKGIKNKYDCLIGISGGEDSSVLAYLAVKVWNLRPLVIHFNNRTNRPEATNNIKVLVDNLNVNFIEYFVDKKEYDELTDSLLMAGVPDCDIANDVVMSKLMYKAAKDHGIKTILNGHSFREEGSSPKAWSVIDYTYLNSVYKHWFGRNLKNYPLLTVWDQIFGAIIGIRQIRPYHYADHGRAGVISKLKEMGWKDYGGKHNENIYTAFIGNYVLPKKFGIDKRRTYLSAHIREGKMTKAYAKEILATPAEFNMDDLAERKNHVLELYNTYPVGSRSDYKMTNFKRLWPVFWVLMKLGIVPQTMYKKYCV
jgi:hypothetical protein